MSKPVTIFPETIKQYRFWGQLHGSAAALAIVEQAQASKSLTLVVTNTTAEALQLETALQFYAGNNIPIFHIPDWETLPYDHFSPHQDIISQRLETLYKLPQTQQGILIAPISTLIQRLPPPDFFHQNVLLINVGEKKDIEAFRQQLSQNGYRHVQKVIEHGEFAVRGSLVDLFPMASSHPYRLDFFDDEIESIRTFDPETQRSIKEIDNIRLLPAHEFPFGDNGIKGFRQRFRASFDGQAKESILYRDVSNGIAPSGIEYYLSLFFDELATLADYLPKNTQQIRFSGFDLALETIWQQVNERYEQHRHDIERPILAPDEIFLSPPALQKIFSDDVIELQSHKYPDTSQFKGKTYHFETLLPPPLPIQDRAENPIENLQNYIESFKGRTLLIAESAGRREALLSLLSENQFSPRIVESWEKFTSSNENLCITEASIDEGLLLDDKIAVITESQLFGKRVRQTRRRQKATRDSNAVIANLTDLKTGSPVVHIDHGVGRYQGMTTINIDGLETEFLTLIYKNDDKLYVPVASLHLISRYTGASPDAAPLHKLGGEQWEKIKRKVSQKVRDVAAELLDIYARRAARQGHAFKIDQHNYRRFAEAFPFEETPDQEQAIITVLADMQGKQPMDRVVCGDVGFGKTEVAMRAAFAAVDGGKQVAVLVPTTLLTDQHHKNFLDRFADWPIRIESLSRFRSAKQQQSIIDELKAGKVDIIIGTHKLLSKTIAFNDLGLVIIDEEHRFGVRHKEHLKSMRSEVDMLTLTATPIPRTLNMSLSGMRDLSIIATPPAHRHAIKTFVSEWDDVVIQEACQRELARGGQIYFLHNEVKSIERVARQIEEIVPEATVRFAHGQMREQELEEAMTDFYHQRFNCLVSTTIIESGIDIPTANTIIINRADKLGLAQLHQLRGRVGRSHHRAYAYLITPPSNIMTSDAKKRLDAIESLEELGVGFTLATHDLEIRGTGELLGEEQSGQIQEIGFTLYTELLERAVNALKSGKISSEELTLNHAIEVNLNIPSLLPSDYLPDVHNRLIMYKRIASAKDDVALRDLQVELIDRFGLLPEQTKNLFTSTEFKLRCELMGIKKLEANSSGGRIIFESEPNIDPMNLIKLIQQTPNVYRFDGQEVLRFSAELDDTTHRIEFIQNLLNAISTTELA